MVAITVDKNSHRVLNWAKEQATKDGIENPSHSDAIRWMKKRIDGSTWK